MIAPILELSLRQSLVMSGGDYAIFLQRPFAASLLGVSLLLLALSIKSAFGQAKDWRTKLADADGGQQPT